MALAPPRLDDRGYADLRAELIRRIPVHAPEWTDHNATDPGIALIELFSFLGDNLLYRLNRAPEASKLAFLRLLNIPPRPARVAMAQVRLNLQGNASDPVTPDFAPAAPRIQLAAGPVLFQPVEEITVLPVELAGWLKQPYSGAVPPEGTAPVEQLLLDHLELHDLGNVPALSAYTPVPMPMPMGGAVPPPSSTSGTVDHALWLCLLAPDAVIKALNPADPAAALTLVRQKISGHVINIGIRTDDALCGPTNALRCPDPGAEPSHWPVRYDISTGRFTGPTKRVDKILYQRLAVSADTTNSIGQSGTVRLRLPDMSAGAPTFGDWTAESFDTPDPDLLGIGGLPPRLDDPKLAARVLAWIRVRRIDTTHPPIRTRLIDANMAMAEQAVTAASELLGNGTGLTAQTLRLSKKPVVAGSEVIQIRADAGWSTWTAVDDIALAGPDDPFYVLDPIDGTVTFGDGVHGRIPLPGQAIRVLGYRYGGGIAGNSGAGGITRVRGAALTAFNPLPAEGGQDAETLAQAQARIPKVLRARDRAVCAEDFSQIALETPGVHVGRAEVLPRHKPFERADGIPGVVTLIVLPAADPVTPDTPTPDREMLRKVCAWLELRRLVTTELYVTPPEYVPIDFSIAVEAEPGTGEETLRRWVELALRQYFAPLPPYGPNGAGWPFGRAVRDRDADAAALHVQGVRLVNEILVQGTEIDGAGVETEVSGTVNIEKWQLPFIRNVAVAIGPTAPPIAPEPPPPADGFPVPVKQEKC